MDNKLYPFAAVSGVGSLPYKTSSEALRTVFQYCPEMPFWPQVPQRAKSEHMVVQPLGRFWDFLDLSQLNSGLVSVSRARVDAFCKLLESSSPELNREIAPGFFEFQQQITEGSRAALYAKAQSVGPMTLLQCLRIGSEPALRFPDICLCVVDFLTRQIVWQIQQLKGKAETLIMILDEPMLQLAARAGGADYTVLRGTLKHALDQIHSNGALSGIHSCAPLVGMEFFDWPVDILSFPCTGEVVFPDRFWNGEEMKRFLVRGGILGLGLETAPPTDAQERLEQLFEETGLDKNQVVRQSYLTAPCGYGTLSASATRASFEFLSAVSLGLREGWGGN